MRALPTGHRVFLRMKGYNESATSGTRTRVSQLKDLALNQLATLQFYLCNIEMFTSLHACQGLNVGAWLMCENILSWLVGHGTPSLKIVVLTAMCVLPRVCVNVFDNSGVQ